MLSFLPIVAAAICGRIAFLILQRSAIGRIQHILGSFTMGLAISSMPCARMTSLQMVATILYAVLLFSAFILVTLMSSVSTLWSAFRPAIGVGFTSFAASLRLSISP